MDLVVIMNERVRHQTAEQRAAVHRFVAVTLVACVCLAGAVFNVEFTVPAGSALPPTMRSAAAQVSGDGGGRAIGPSSTPMFLILWLTGNACLIAGMNIAVQGAARQTAMHNAAHFWIPTTTAAASAAPHNVASSPASRTIMLAAYVVCAVLVGIAAFAGWSPTVAMLLQSGQLALYLARCYEWRLASRASSS